MKQIGQVLPSGRSLSSPRNSAMARGALPAQMPSVLNRMTDIEIPRSAWSNWIPSDGPRKLRRHLTATERSALVHRRQELAPWVAPFEGRQEANRVALAVMDMLGSFRSMRQVEEAAVAQVDAIQRLLAPFPAWAIENACRSIQQDGVWRNGAFDRQWPPNDSEIIAKVRDNLRLYNDQYRSAVALLEAEVDA